MTPLQTEALQDSARIAGAPTHRPSCRQDTKKGPKPPRIQSPYENEEAFQTLYSNQP